MSFFVFLFVTLTNIIIYLIFYSLFKEPFLWYNVWLLFNKVKFISLLCNVTALLSKFVFDCAALCV